MASDDPFFSPPSDDRTIIRPRPGGRSSDIRPDPVIPVQLPPTETAIPRLGHLNPLESASSGLLALLTRLNISRTQSDTVGLKEKITGEIKQFQITAQAQGIDAQTITSARYVLCTVLDEAVLNTPWGHNSSWTQQSLLSLFHNEVSGGERFFHLLKSLAQNPAKNRNLLELMYLCLGLGFKGRYQLIDGGRDKLTSIREWLYQILQKERGYVEHTLSPHWQGIRDKRNPLIKLMPLWVIGALSVGFLSILFSIFLFQLNNDSDPVFREIYAINPPAIQIPVIQAFPLPKPKLQPQPQPKPKPQITLSILLDSEIRSNQLKVLESTELSTVIIHGDNLFSSGSTSVNSSIMPLLKSIAKALNQLPGQVEIIGHSDNVPIRSARYPSNWHLSKARAESVAAIIKQNLTNPERVSIEGRADLEPVASNKTREGRAKNRRVEIVLLK